MPVISVSTQAHKGLIVVQLNINGPCTDSTTAQTWTTTGKTTLTTAGFTVDSVTGGFYADVVTVS